MWHIFLCCVSWNTIPLYISPAGFVWLYHFCTQSLESSNTETYACMWHVMSKQYFSAHNFCIVCRLQRRRISRRGYVCEFLVLSKNECNSSCPVFCSFSIEGTWKAKIGVAQRGGRRDEGLKRGDVYFLYWLISFHHLSNWEGPKNNQT